MTDGRRRSKRGEGLLTIEDRRVRLDSLRTLRYLQCGRSKRAVLYLPPFGVTADFWAPLLSSMAQTGRAAYALDIPGYGASSPPRSPYLGYYARVVGEFIRAMDLESVTLVGNSLGGSVALGLYLQAPRQVNALVLADVFGLGASLPVSPWSLWNLVLPSFWLGLFGRGDWAYWRMLHAVFCSIPKDVEERFRVGSGWQWIKGVLPRSAALLALGRRLGLPDQRRRFLLRIQDQARRAPVPILVIWGENDRMLPHEHTREIQAVLPEAEVEIFPQTGHHPPAENPEGFQRRIAGFLEKNGL